MIPEFCGPGYAVEVRNDGYTARVSLSRFSGVRTYLALSGGLKRDYTNFEPMFSTPFVFEVPSPRFEPFVPSLEVQTLDLMEGRLAGWLQECLTQHYCRSTVLSTGEAVEAAEQGVAAVMEAIAQHDADEEAAELRAFPCPASPAYAACQSSPPVFTGRYDR